MSIENLTVGEIRSLLIEKYGLSNDEVYSIKGKSSLVEALQAEINREQVFGEPVELDITSNSYMDKDDEVIIDRSSPEWSDYVLSLLVEDEIMVKNDNRYPTLKGLRRVFYKLFGSPIFSGIVEYSSPTTDSSPGRAHANYEIKFSYYGDILTYRGAADAYSGNINGGFQVYPLAIAENRAEARAYRKALMLNIVTAEEIGNEANEFTSVLSSSGEFNDSEPVSASQLLVIKNKTKELSIDMDKFLNYMKTELGVEQLSKKEGLLCVKKIGDYSNNPKLIPGELK